MKQKIFLGTSSGGEGIFAGWFNAVTGEISALEMVSDLAKPSWLRFADNGLLLASSQPAGDDVSGEMYSFHVDTNGLTEVGRAKSGGNNPVAFDERDGVVAVANYVSGSASSQRLAQDGALAVESLIAFDASEHGPDEKRQTQSYAHDATFSPDGRFVLFNDLGCDCIRVYAVERPSGKLTAHGEWKSVPGAGPRHITIHPNGRWFYNLNEMGCTVDQLLWDAKAGSLQTLSTVETLPAGASKVDVRACEIVFGKDARFAYVANRVHEDFVVYAVNAETGALTEVQRVANPGKESRHIAVAPSGNYLLSANQFTHEVLVFAIDESTGHLGEVVSRAEVNGPSCILFG